eukprot:425723-Pyramimonas_sp.AAC.1
MATFATSGMTPAGYQDAVEEQEYVSKKVEEPMLVYPFIGGAEGTAGDSTMKQLLGGKGANLAQMAKLGLAVPPGFTISTDACQLYHAGKGRLPLYLWDQ